MANFKIGNYVRVNPNIETEYEGHDEKHIVNQLRKEVLLIKDIDTKKKTVLVGWGENGPAGWIKEKDLLAVETKKVRNYEFFLKGGHDIHANSVERVEEWRDNNGVAKKTYITPLGSYVVVVCDSIEAIAVSEEYDIYKSSEEGWKAVER